MNIFIICGIVGLAVLALGIIFDGVFDFLDDTIVPAVGVALTVFGSAGLISTAIVGTPSTNAGIYGSVFITALIFSVVLTVLFIIGWKLLKKYNSSDNLVEVDIDSILGSTGEILFWGENGGEALFEYLGGNSKINVISKNGESFKFGDNVVAVDKSGDNFIVEALNNNNLDMPKEILPRESSSLSDFR